MLLTDKVKNPQSSRKQRRRAAQRPNIEYITKIDSIEWLAIVLPRSKWGAGFPTGGKTLIHIDRQPAPLERNALDMISGNR